MEAPGDEKVIAQLFMRPAYSNLGPGTPPAGRDSWGSWWRCAPPDRPRRWSSRIERAHRHADVSVTHLPRGSAAD